MKNLAHCNSLIRVVVIIVVMAFMASQVTGTYAQGNLGNLGNIQKKLDDILAEVQKPPAAVPKTNQTGCYDNYGNPIPCLNTGHDADTNAGVSWPNPRFTDNQNGTVTDNMTKLIWDKRANRFGAKAWDYALLACNQLADNGTDLTDGSSEGDWHLANRNELVSLVNREWFDPVIPNTVGTSQWEEGDPFTGLQTSIHYWSSSTWVRGPINAWYVVMRTGALSAEEKWDDGWVWCVRYGP